MRARTRTARLAGRQDGVPGGSVRQKRQNVTIGMIAATRSEAVTMLARVCAAQMARTIVRALHVATPEAAAPAVQVDKPKRKIVKSRKKRKVA
jgi:hypothetical protein